MIRSWLPTVLAIAAAVTFTHTVAGTVLIPSGSMEPTMRAGDFLAVNRLAYSLHVPFTSTLEVARWGMPARGDIVIFNAPAAASRSESLFIKRVVALAGDVVQVKDHRLTVNRQPAAYWASQDGSMLESLDGRSVHRIQATPSAYADFGPYVVPDGSVFVMGDHRDDSSDSRLWGPLALNRVRGQAVLRLAHIGLPPAGPVALR